MQYGMYLLPPCFAWGKVVCIKIALSVTLTIFEKFTQFWRTDYNGFVADAQTQIHQFF
jgi:hypothetical protein